MKIVFLDALTVGEVPNMHVLSSLGDFTLYPTTAPSQVSGRIRDAEIIITNKVILNRETIDHAPKLKLICLSATGMNNVDLEYCKTKGIPVMNVAGYSTESVAQTTFTMILYLLNKPLYYDRYVKSGEYSSSDIFTHIGPSFHQLSGKDFGIIGLGSIGKKVAAIATAFGASVSYYSTTGLNNCSDYRRMDLPGLLALCDIISIHAPLNSQTTNLINEKNIPLMKPGALLVNAGRGGIVNETAIAAALDSHRIAGYATDVLSAEPISSANPLLHVKNPDTVLIFPHIAWASIEARTLLIERIAENIRKFYSQT